MKNEHPSGRTRLTGKKHHEMYHYHQYHRNIHGEDGGEHVVLICSDLRDRRLCPDAGSQICGQPCQGGRPGMYRQGDRNGEYPAQILDELCFPYFESISAFSAFTVK